MEEEIERFKNKKRNINSKKENSFFKILLSKTLIVILITLIVLISVKSSLKIEKFIKKNFFETTFNFNDYLNKYTKYFNEFFPFENLFKAKTVFNEELKFLETSKYLDGVKLIVSENYLVPALESGLVVFVGEKDGYGNVVIVQQVNGVDVWYGNLNNIAIDLYDYIETGSLIGEVKDNYLYLVLEKEGNYVNYEEYS